MKNKNSGTSNEFTYDLSPTERWEELREKIEDILCKAVGDDGFRSGSYKVSKKILSIVRSTLLAQIEKDVEGMKKRIEADTRNNNLDSDFVGGKLNALEDVLQALKELKEGV